MEHNGRTLAHMVKGLSQATCAGNEIEKNV
jgi:hypothetical protein